ncbi:TetR/AcrR family transcriptional regulator [Kribbella solani]|uniref:AcrR family transcriptional regulator n=1 Tax=Kribbella solani TaxID=236067 RepID=A0A841DYJ5_9ACTN|nr:TetR family transcriptional regulator [Kribbella solani]MBB5981840.1 AcrR family transcriptional regulator [Kribbella solani]MDX2969096.1 TetR/AcrR family transcriptional regulator [Kribbella solani]MDX3001382.1 TetR/AcrR family transcriptional regulator [Kribbella solani]
MSEVLRAPQQDRSRATRQRLLEAAVESLAEVGYAATTVSVVATRAGVSRGAAQHHFPTRADLFAAAVEYMTEVRLAEIRAQASDLPSGAGRTEAIVGMLADVYTGPLFRAALHLWVAASTEEALRQQIVRLEAHVGRQAHRALLEVLEVSERTAGVRETVQGVLDMARGLGLAALLTDDSARRRGIVRQWSRILDQALREPGV